MSENEIWKQMEESPNYLISNLGRVKRKPYVVNKSDGTIQTYKEKLCTIHHTGVDYCFVNLQIAPNTKKAYSLHRLVAKYFIPNPLNLPEVNHIDGNKDNNKMSNLEWCTSAENQMHAVQTGLAVYTEEHKAKISKNGKGSRTVYVYDEDENLLYTFKNTKELAKHFNRNADVMRRYINSKPFQGKYYIRKDREN